MVDEECGPNAGFEECEYDCPERTVCLLDEINSRADKGDKRGKAPRHGLVDDLF